MELPFTTWLALVMLAARATDAGQIGPIAGHQDLIHASDVPVSHSSQTEHSPEFHEIFLFGQRIRAPLKPGVDNELCFKRRQGDLSHTNLYQIPSEENEGDGHIINDIVDDDTLNQCSKRRRLSDDTSGCLSLSSFSVGMPDSSPFSSARRVSAKHELDLNLKSIEENYAELCQLLGKEQNPIEIAILKTSAVDVRLRPDTSVDPISIEVNGDRIYITEWSEISYAMNTLVKLILVVRFYQKIAPIWDSIETRQKTKRLQRPYQCALAIMLCLTGCCQNDLIKFQEGRANPFCHYKFRTQRCPDHQPSDINNEMSVSYLNLKAVDVNYSDLCRLLGKPEDTTELTRLQEWIHNGLCHHILPKSSPITVKVNGQVLYTTEWSQMGSARSTLVKLILAVRFYQNLSPIWDEISSDQKTARLKRQYRCVCAMVFCLQHCCGGDLVKFRERWDNQFRYSTFSIQCCGAVFRPGSQCGIFGKQTAAA